MNMQDSHSSGRRRGPRRRRHHEGGHHHNHGSQHNNQAPREPQAQAAASAPKLTFFQKIMSFFGFGPKAKTYPPYEGGSQTARPGNPASNPNRFEKEYSAAARTPQESRPAAPSRPVRKPEAVEVNSPKLYVGNLSFDATESDLSELFNGVGAVRNVEIVTYRDTEKSKGFGFVLMTAVDEAKRAVAELHDKEFMGRRLVVSGAKTNDRAA